MQALWMIVASLLFACMGVCVKLASATHSAVEITFYRSFISLLMLCVLVRAQRVPLATPHWRWQLIRGFVGFLAVFSYFYAITLLPLATAVTLNTHGMTNILTAAQAAEALKLAAGIGKSLSGRLLLLDALEMEWRTVRFKKDAGCAVCGPTKDGQAPGYLPRPDADRESADGTCRLA